MDEELMQVSRRTKLRGVLQASCCLKRSDCCLPPTPVYFLEDSRRFYELLSPVLLLLSLTVLQLVVIPNILRIICKFALSLASSELTLEVKMGGNISLPEYLARVVSAMSSLEQRANIKLCVKLKRSFTETLALMSESNEDEKLSRTQVYFWYKCFKDGRKSIADDSSSGRLLTSPTDRNIGQVQILGISYGSCQKIIGEHLNMKKLCGYFVPRILTDQQKESRLSICKHLIETTNNDSDFFRTIITGDETWCFPFDPQTKKKKNNHSNGTHQVLLGRRKFVLTIPKQK
ncbi:hypothetical protein LAZ67_X002588 [Cordylochernes scorpioides]|uniref:Mos1 transposase HTH domain-containing protein n=1 Tax=Cordylochernes scorpioides TaxID=51811 RepID=A0ABY6LVY8_9ARAC|nr:hypothetical protein LAZ67_X002588 [Cordylochernes scorpioides]